MKLHFGIFTLAILATPLAAQSTRGEIRRGADEISQEIQRASKEISDKIEDASFRVETDENGKPLHLPSEFYTFRAGDPTQGPNWFPDERRAALKAKAYQAAWNRYNAKVAMSAQQQVEQKPKTAEDALREQLEESKQLARRLYPSLNVPNSALAKRWQLLYDALPKNDPMRYDSNTPLKLTIRAANQLRIFPNE